MLGLVSDYGAIFPNFITNTNTKSNKIKYVCLQRIMVECVLNYKVDIYPSCYPEFLSEWQEYIAAISYCFVLLVFGLMPFMYCDVGVERITQQ